MGKTLLLFNVTRSSEYFTHSVLANRQRCAACSWFFSWNRHSSFPLIPSLLSSSSFSLSFSSSFPVWDVDVTAEKVQLFHNYEGCGGPGQIPPKYASVAYWLFQIKVKVTQACPTLSMGFSRQEHWSGLPCPPPGDLHNPGIKPRSPALQVASLLSEPPGKPKNTGVGILSLLQWIFPTQS